MNPATLAAEQRRLEILQILFADPDYRMNDTLLKKMLQMGGTNISQAELGADLAWLERVGVIATQSLPTGKIALLRTEGVDVVEGTAHIPGIARPRPEL